MRPNPPLTEFLFGGCVLVRPYHPPADRHPTFFPGDLLPPPILSASPCICDLLPDDWNDWPTDEESIAAYQSEWGVPRDCVEAFQSWKALMTGDGRIRHGDVFADLETARQCARQFLAKCPDVRLLALGLYRDLLPGYLEAVGDTTSLPPDGVLDLVRTEQALPAGARHLGYEVLDVWPSEQRHSWHCHALEREMHDKRGTRLGAYGLIVSHDDACQVAAICDDDDYGCEPGVWRAWRIVEYGLNG